MVTKEDLRRLNIFAEKSTAFGNQLADILSSVIKFCSSKIILMFGVIIIIVGFTAFGIINRRVKINDKVS